MLQGMFRDWTLLLFFLEPSCSETGRDKESMWPRWMRSLHGDGISY